METKKKANRAWEERNREKTRFSNYRRSARLFIRIADVGELKELSRLIDERLGR